MTLKADFTRALPSGVMDDSTFEAVENALDRAGAPLRDGGRWLTLPERIAAIGAALAPFATYAKAMLDTTIPRHIQDDPHTPVLAAGPDGGAEVDVADFQRAAALAS